MFNYFIGAIESAKNINAHQDKLWIPKHSALVTGSENINFSLMRRKKRAIQQPF